ncbi:MAG TPA: hypothetical protein VH278_00500 [Burkholderiaceae bacterium]|jgi:hypothetical protein|nr:hypothetical protein [Burkholderiaceae bacterium]
MHTVGVVAIGLTLLGLCALVGRAVDGVTGIAVAALVFLPVWFVGAGINLLVGVRNAGYSLVDEAPIFFVVFAVPAAVALLAWSKYH